MSSDSLSTQLLRAISLLSPLDPASLYQRNTALSTGRPGLHSQLFNHLKSFGGVQTRVVDPPSSDEEEEEGKGVPSLRKVVEAVLDSHLCEVEDRCTPWPHHDPAILLINLRARIKPSEVLTKIRSLTHSVRKVHVVDFQLSSSFRRCAVIFVPQQDAAVELFERLRRKENCGTLSAWINSTKGIDRSVSVKWIRYLVKDKQRQWSGVVFRNLDLDYTSEQLSSLLRSHHFPHLRIEPPRLLDTNKVALVVVPDLSTAESICAAFHRTVIEGNLVKVHIHPDSMGRSHEPPHTTDTSSIISSNFDVFELIRGSGKGDSLKSALEESPLKRLVRSLDADPCYKEK